MFIEEVSSLEEFIMKVEIPNFKRFLETAPISQSSLMRKLILVIAQADISLRDFQLHNNDLPIISYLSHNGKIEINYTHPKLETWLGEDEFYLDLKTFNLPIIEGKTIDNKIHINLRESPVIWKNLENLCNVFEIYKIPDETFTIEGFLNYNSVKSICKINSDHLTSEICFLPPCKKTNEFHSKCDLYGVKLPKYRY